MISKSTLAKIHIAKQQLGMDDDSYRAMLHSVAGVSSAKDLDAQGAAKVMRHLERCGFKPVHSHGRRPRYTLTREAQLGKIEALLADAGRPWDYVHAMVKRICKVDAIEFCDSDMLGKLIAALQIDANRRKS
ncbi:gp16 family protein [Burkholderia cepacia]|uniref:gp16 family protein n=1 Tax=Burkholderia cepacia TaxID=292 RepID=UPI001E49A870|nr:regulatory protein GemA [Burkholderia cepacia]